MTTTRTAHWTILVALAMTACATPTPQFKALGSPDAFSRAALAFEATKRDPNATAALIQALADANLCASAVFYAESAIASPAHFPTALEVLAGPCKDIRPGTDTLRTLDKTNPDPGPLSDLYHYNMGRWLYQSGDRAASQRHFEAVKDSSTHAPRAHYFRGVLCLSNKTPDKLDRALAFFRTAQQNTTGKPDARDIFELSTLAMARIRYEQKNYSAALIQYGKIPLDSKHRADVLFESFWVHYASGDPSKAFDTLDVLLSIPHFFPDVHVIRADLMSLNRQFKEGVHALRAFDKQYKRHTPALEAFLAEGDAVQRYERLSSRLSKRAGTKPSDLPRIWLQAAHQSGALARHHKAIERISAEIDAIKTQANSLGALAEPALKRAQAALAREKTLAGVALDATLVRALDEVNLMALKAEFIGLDIEKTRLMEHEQNGAK